MLGPLDLSVVLAESWLTKLSYHGYRIMYHNTVFLLSFCFVHRMDDSAIDSHFLAMVINDDCD